MHQVVAVSVRNGFNNLSRYAQRFFEFELRLAAQFLTQRFANHIGHREERQPVRFARVVERQDVGVLERCLDFDFA